MCTIQIDQGVTIALVALFLAMIQFAYNLRKQKFDATIHMIEKLQSPEAQRDRFELQYIMKRVDNDCSKLSIEDRAKISNIAAHFGLAEILIEKNACQKRCS